MIYCERAAVWKYVTLGFSRGLNQLIHEKKIDTKQFHFLWLFWRLGFCYHWMFVWLPGLHLRNRIRNSATWEAWGRADTTPEIQIKINQLSWDCFLTAFLWRFSRHDLMRGDPWAEHWRKQSVFVMPCDAPGGSFFLMLTITFTD